MSFMGWEPLPSGVSTLAEILARHGFHTAASVDTPYYLRDGMNYDRGFQSFFMNAGQDTLWSLIPEPGYHHESLDVRAAWRNEADRNAPKTFMAAMRWLERHYKEDFFLYVDTWDPHEPWDAPPYYTELYLWSLLYSPVPGVSQLYNLHDDPNQLDNVIETRTEVALELHRTLVRFMRETGVPERLLRPRLELRM